MPEKNYGFFTGEVKTLWGTNSKKDSEMQLLEDFSYTDPDGKVWKAEADIWIDGASIPSIFWGPTIGSPYVGDYRRASVVHDAAFYTRPDTAMNVHKMFYYAMRCDGTRKSKALLMYFAVVMYKPNWDRTRKITGWTMENIQDVLAETLLEVDSTNSLDEIEIKFRENWNRPLLDGDELYL